MKIVLATHHFPPKYIAGAEKEAYQVAKGLAARGHTLDVVCVEDISHSSMDGLTWEDSIYDGLPVRRLSYDLRAAPDRSRWEYDNPWIGEHLEAFLDEKKPDLFFLVGGYLMTGSAVLAARRRKIPTVVELTDFWYLCPRINLLRSDGSLSTLPIQPARCARCLGEEKRRYRIPGQLAPGMMDAYWLRKGKAVHAIEQRTEYLRGALAGVDRMISASQFLKSVYVQAGFPDERIVTIRQGLELPAKRMLPAGKLVNEHLRLGYLGQFAPHKGVHLLVEAIRSIRSKRLELKLYGDIRAFPAYSASVISAMRGDKRMRWEGIFHGREELERILRELDVLVLPSTCYENSPTVILEAFSGRIPVIAANIGGMAELVQHERNGLLFEAGSATDLEKQIRRLLDEPELLKTLRQGIPAVKETSRQIDEIETLFLELLSKQELPQVIL